MACEKKNRRKRRFDQLKTLKSGYWPWASKSKFHSLGQTWTNRFWLFLVLDLLWDGPPTNDKKNYRKKNYRFPIGSPSSGYPSGIIVLWKKSWDVALPLDVMVHRYQGHPPRWVPCRAEHLRIKAQHPGPRRGGAVHGAASCGRKFFVCLIWCPIVWQKDLNMLHYISYYFGLAESMNKINYKINFQEEVNILL